MQENHERKEIHEEELKKYGSVKKDSVKMALFDSPKKSRSTLNPIA